jgi:hypothetical protein
MAKNVKKIQVRWELDRELHKKIGAYQKYHGIVTMQAAGHLLLEKITQNLTLSDK